MVTPECCKQFMKLKSTDRVANEESRKYGPRIVFAYHFQCTRCGETKIELVRK